MFSRMKLRHCLRYTQLKMYLEGLKEPVPELESDLDLPRNAVTGNSDVASSVTQI